MPEVNMPRLSDTMTEGVLSRWIKNEGDHVREGDVIAEREGDVIAEIDTDKATMDLEAFDEGILEKHLVPEGTTVPIGEPLALTGTGTATASSTVPPVALAGASPTPAGPSAPDTPSDSERAATTADRKQAPAPQA